MTSGAIADLLVKCFIAWQVLIALFYMIDKQWTNVLYWVGAIALTTAVLIKGN